MVVKMINFLDDLESNDLQKVEEFKTKLKEQFNATKEAWMVNGMYDYYLLTNSIKAVDVLVSVKEPHDKHFFDRAFEGIKSNNKLSHLTLLGYIVHKKPIWLYGISDHPVLKELLNLLKVETNDIVIIVSALLIINILLPLIPGVISQYLQEIFAVFSKLAAVNTNSNNFHEAQLVHLQISLYTLFHRLYGMFPCNFVSYLRKEYCTTETSPVFFHTVKPMLDTVKINPLLIAANQDWEISANRWKNVEPHDILISCAKLLINGNSTYETNAPQFDIKASFNCKSILGTIKVTNKQTFADYCKQLSNVTKNATLWSPSVHYMESKHHDIESTPTSIPVTPIVRYNNPKFVMLTDGTDGVEEKLKCEMQRRDRKATVGFEVSSPYSEHEGSSPPEAAVEATPETTPIRDYLGVSPVLLPVPQHALTYTKDNSLLNTKVPMSDRSFPSSPIKKDSSPFRYSAPEIIPITILSPHSKKINKMLNDRNQVTGEEHVIESVQQDLFSQVNSYSSKIINNNANNSKLDDTFVLNKEKEELSLNELTARENNKQLTDNTWDDLAEEGDAELCSKEKSSSLCSSGGLHMPNKRLLRNFTKHISRMCHYNQRHSESRVFSTGTSPQDNGTYLHNLKVRRAHSCPEIEKNDAPNTNTLNNFTKKEIKRDKKAVGVIYHEILDIKNKISPEKNLMNVNGKCDFSKYNKICAGTQTEKIPPYHFPYEHLFLDVFPPLHSASSVDQIFPTESDNLFDEKPISVYEQTHTPSKILKNYIEVAAKCHTDRITSNTQYNVEFLVNQLQLMRIQLQFAEHIREMYAERIRRLLGRSRRNKTLEEHIHALTDQVLLLRNELDNNSEETEKLIHQIKTQIKHEQEAAEYWKNEYTSLQKEHKSISDRLQEIETFLKEEKRINMNNQKLINESRAALIDVTNELKAYQKEAEEAKDLRTTVAELQCELLKAGEIVIKYRRKLAEIIKIPSESIQNELIHSAYIDEVNKLKKRINTQSACIEALKASMNTLTEEMLEKENYIEKLIANARNEKKKQDQEIQEFQKKNKELELSYYREQERSNELLYKLNLAKRVSKLQQLPRNTSEHLNSSKSTSFNSGVSSNSGSFPVADNLGVLKSPTLKMKELDFENNLKQDSEKKFDLKKIETTVLDNVWITDHKFREVNHSVYTSFENDENQSVSAVNTFKQNLCNISESSSFFEQKCGSNLSGEPDTSVDFHTYIKEFENTALKESRSKESYTSVGKRKTRMECAETGQLRPLSLDSESSVTYKKSE